MSNVPPLRLPPLPPVLTLTYGVDLEEAGAAGPGSHLQDPRCLGKEGGAVNNKYQPRQSFLL